MGEVDARTRRRGASPGPTRCRPGHRGARRAPFLEDAPRPRVAEHHAPGRHDLLAQGRPSSPRPAAGRSISPTIDLDDAVEQVVLVPDVAVERHRVDAQLLAELAHAQGLEAAAVGELDGGPEHALAGQRRAALSRFGRLRSPCRRFATLTSVRCRGYVYGVVYTVDMQEPEDAVTDIDDATDQQARPPQVPRWLVRTIWIGHRAAYRLTGGRFGLRTADRRPSGGCSGSRRSGARPARSGSRSSATSRTARTSSPRR